MNLSPIFANNYDFLFFKVVDVKIQNSSAALMEERQPRDQTLLVVLVMLPNLVAVLMELKKLRVKTSRVV